MSSFQDLIKGEKPILVDFYADWCAPCKAMNPILKSVKSKMGDQIKILKIPQRRGPFKEAIIHYEDITPLFIREINQNKFVKKISFGRRPTKSSRRKLDKFLGRNF